MNYKLIPVGVYYDLSVAPRRYSASKYLCVIFVVNIKLNATLIRNNSRKILLKMCRTRSLTESELEQHLYVSDDDGDDSVSEVENHLSEVDVYDCESDDEVEPIIPGEGAMANYVTSKDGNIVWNCYTPD